VTEVNGAAEIVINVRSEAKNILAKVAKLDRVECARLLANITRGESASRSRSKDPIPPQQVVC
jgi:hypothetical protein